mgnify:CR=1 FL=1
MPDELEFVLLVEPYPDDGAVVELKIPNPDHAKALAAYREVLERNPFAENHVIEAFAPGLAHPAESLIGADEYCVECARLTLVVGYPFPGQYAVTVTASTPRGFTRAELFRQLVRVHSAMYEGAAFGPARTRLNTHVESPRFGTAWHRLDDLVVEGVLVQTRDDGRLFAWIALGS